MKGFPKSVIKHDRYGLGRKVSRSAPASNSSSWFSQQESCRCNHHHVLLAQTHISLRLLNFCYLYHIFLLLSHLYTTHTSLTHTLTPSHTSCTHIHIHASYTHTCTHMHYTHIIHTHAHISYTCTHIIHNTHHSHINTLIPCTYIHVHTCIIHSHMHYKHIIHTNTCTDTTFSVRIIYRKVYVKLTNIEH